VIIDGRDMRPGDKQYYWEQHGVPFRIECGPRDVDAGQVMLKRRLDRGKESVPIAQADAAWLRGKLEDAQKAMFDKALAYRASNTRDAGSYDELKALLAQGGFVRAFFKPDKAAEARIKDETKATVRCIPLENENERGKCIISGAEDGQRVLFALAY
jgi:prolyl-tRNA synthetase